MHILCVDSVPGGKQGLGCQDLRKSSEVRRRPSEHLHMPGPKRKKRGILTLNQKDMDSQQGQNPFALRKVQQPNSVRLRHHVTSSPYPRLLLHPSCSASDSGGVDKIRSSSFIRGPCNVRFFVKHLGNLGCALRLRPV